MCFFKGLEITPALRQAIRDCCPSLKCCYSTSNCFHEAEQLQQEHFSDLSLVEWPEYDTSDDPNRCNGAHRTLHIYDEEVLDLYIDNPACDFKLRAESAGWTIIHGTDADDDDDEDNDDEDAEDQAVYTTQKKFEPRAKSGWMVFLSEYRPTFAAENPDVKGITEVTKAAGVIWMTKTAEEKEVNHPLLRTSCRPFPHLSLRFTERWCNMLFSALNVLFPALCSSLINPC